jgi:hypothetical protein
LLSIALVSLAGCGHGKKKAPAKDDKYEHKPGDGHDHGKEEHKPGDGHDHGKEEHKPGDGHDHGSSGSK